MRSRFLYVFLLLSLQLSAQEYGLSLNGNEVISEQRSSLIVGKDYSICTGIDFSVEFNFRINPIPENYFGYILRLVDKQGRNFDIIYNGAFKFILGENPIVLESNIDSTHLLKDFNHIKLDFSQRKNTITVTVNGKAQKPVSVSKLAFDCFEIHFGQCTIAGFRNKDVISLDLSDLKISSNDNLQHYWKLDETEGNIARDDVGQENAEVIRPNWILRDHVNWKTSSETHWRGIIAITPLPASSSFTLFTNQGIQRLRPGSDTVALVNKENDWHIEHGDVAIPFRKEANKGLIRLNSEEIFISNGEEHITEIPEANKLTEYWHHNLYVYPEDTAVVCIGGYGMYAYKNKFQKYSLQTGKWEDLTMKGELPNPRYLAGFGTASDGLTSYYIGGYGSKSGDQLLKPQNYYDLFKIDWRTNEVKKIYVLPANEEEPFVFASNIIIDEQSDTYYGLIFNQLKYNTELQLIEGSLSSPEYKKLGNPIPINFHDVNTQVSLFSNEAGRKLMCSVINYDNQVDESTLRIFSIATPPGVVSENENETSESYWYWVLIPVLGLIFIMYLNYRKEQKAATAKAEITPAVPDNLPAQIVNTNPEGAYDGKPQIRLFGKFQVLAADGEDLSKAFTPLLKEIFLYLLLNSLRYKKGLSSDKLDETFWFDKNKASARNNRSVNLIKIKGLLAELGGIELDKKTGNWEITFDPQIVYLDYAKFLQITSGSKSTVSREDISQLKHIVNHGTFLPNLEYEWLDAFKGEISNKVIDSFLAYSQGLSPEKDAEELIELADHIFLFDSIDESAMIMKCKSLHHLGKHSLAKQTYESFSKKYEDLFSENYALSFSQVLES